jgi:hypothetical protein
VVPPYLTPESVTPASETAILNLHIAASAIGTSTEVSAAASDPVELILPAVAAQPAKAANKNAPEIVGTLNLEGPSVIGPLFEP